MQQHTTCNITRKQSNYRASFPRVSSILVSLPLLIQQQNNTLQAMDRIASEAYLASTKQQQIHHSASTADTITNHRFVYHDKQSQNMQHHQETHSNHQRASFPRVSNTHASLPRVKNLPTEGSYTTSFYTPPQTAGVFLLQLFTSF